MLFANSKLNILESDCGVEESEKKIQKSLTQVDKSFSFQDWKHCDAISSAFPFLSKSCWSFCERSKIKFGEQTQSKFSNLSIIEI